MDDVSRSETGYVHFEANYELNVHIKSYNSVFAVRATDFRGSEEGLCVKSTHCGVMASLLKHRKYKKTQ